MAGPSNNISEQVKRQMNQPQIHDAWERNYRSPENEQFFEQAYGDFVRQYRPTARFARARYRLWDLREFDPFGAPWIHCFGCRLF